MIGALIVGILLTLIFIIGTIINIKREERVFFLCLLLIIAICGIFTGGAINDIIRKNNNNKNINEDTTFIFIPEKQIIIYKI